MQKIGLSLNIMILMYHNIKSVNTVSVCHFEILVCPKIEVADIKAAS